jgi:hypothetical protein
MTLNRALLCSSPEIKKAQSEPERSPVGLSLSNSKTNSAVLEPFPAFLPHSIDLEAWAFSSRKSVRNNIIANENLMRDQLTHRVIAVKSFAL